MTTARMNSCRESELGWTHPRKDRQVELSFPPSMFNRSEWRNNLNPSGPYGWLWKDQLLEAFKAIIFISHPQWAILISDEGPMVRRQKENNKWEERTTCVHLHFVFLQTGMSKIPYFVIKTDKTHPWTYFIFSSGLCFTYVKRHEQSFRPIQ